MQQVNADGKRRLPGRVRLDIAALGDASWLRLKRCLALYLCVRRSGYGVVPFSRYMDCVDDTGKCGAVRV